MATAKRRTNLTIEAVLLDEARDFGLNVSAIAEGALAQAVREAKGRAWAEENAEAMAERRAWVEKNGLPLAKYQAWKIG